MRLCAYVYKLCVCHTGTVSRSIRQPVLYTHACSPFPPSSLLYPPTHPPSLGAYIISMAKTASDVLAVVLLQRETGEAEAACGCMRVTLYVDWGVCIRFCAGVHGI